MYRHCFNSNELKGLVENINMRLHNLPLIKVRSHLPLLCKTSHSKPTHVSPCRLHIRFKLVAQICWVDHQKLLGLKATSVWVVLYALIPYTIDFICLRNFAEMLLMWPHPYSKYRVTQMESKVRIFGTQNEVIRECGRVIS